MKRWLILFALLLVCAVSAQEASAPNIAQAIWQESEPPTPQVSTEELRQILADGSAMVFDTRPYQEYAVSHIPGALNVAPKPGMPMSEYTSDVAEIGRLVNGDKDALLQRSFLRQEQAALRRPHRRRL